MENYKLKELTPKEMRCGAGFCPAIHELTPKEMQCGAGMCPSIYDNQESYLIIGTKINPNDFGLEKKVGNNEVLIMVSKKLIDEKEKSQVL